MSILSQSSPEERHTSDVVRRSGSSFTLGIRLLPRRKRYAMCAIYAFAREVDDIADSNRPQAEKLVQLTEWRHHIQGLFEGRAECMTARALLDPVRRFDLAQEEFYALIDGVEMDVRGEMYVPTYEYLKLYCRRVAGAVGMLSLSVFGVDGVDAERFALSLGLAFQLTNILRDIDEDAVRGRIYLPCDLFEKYGIDPYCGDAVCVVEVEGIDLVCRDLKQEAYAHYRYAREVRKHLPRRALYPALLMWGVYERLLVRLERRGWVAPRRQLWVSTPEKLWYALLYALFLR